MENTPKENDLVKGIQRIMEKSIKANTQIVTETSKTFSSLISKSPELSDMQKLNADVLSHTLSNFMEVNFKYAESLIDLGVQLSKDISSFVETLNKKEASEIVASSVKEAVFKKSELRLAGQAGEKVHATFVLNSSSDEEQKGTFKATRGKSDATGKLTNIYLKFSPKSFKISPGGQTEIEISADLPKSSKAGPYRSSVTVVGFDDTEFEVVVHVEEKENPKK